MFSTHIFLSVSVLFFHQVTSVSRTETHSKAYAPLLLSKYDPAFKYLSVFPIMYVSRCVFPLFQADLICSFPAHLSNLYVVLYYVSSLLVSRTPSYLPSSADIITVIALWLPSKPWVTIQNETHLTLLPVASSWKLQPLFIFFEAFQPILRSFLMVQRIT